MKDPSRENSQDTSRTKKKLPVPSSVFHPVRVTRAAVTRAFKRLINAARGGLITFHAPGAAAREIDREKTALRDRAVRSLARCRELHVSHDAAKY
jgi:hypothetical protein